MFLGFLVPKAPPMQHGLRLPFVDKTVVEAGLTYGREKYHLNFNPDFLVLLYDTVRSYRPQFGGSVKEAQVFVLDFVFGEESKVQAEKYAMYQKILGAMGSAQAQLSADPSKPRKPRKRRTPLERIKDFVTLPPGNRQYEFLLPHGKE
jgi:hypothetical protein